MFSFLRFLQQYLSYWKSRRKNAVLFLHILLPIASFLFLVTGTIENNILHTYALASLRLLPFYNYRLLSNINAFSTDYR